MTIEQLFSLISMNFSAGDVMDNPSGGITTIVSIRSDKLSYIRGKSRMYLPCDTILAVISNYFGGILTTNMLKQFAPSIFDQKYGGHNCNCTFLMCILTRLEFTECGIQGSGRRGDPFFVRMKASA